jgi:regulator of replication initiation timing
MTSIATLLRTVRKHFLNANKRSMETEVVQMKPEFFTNLAQLKSEFNSVDDHIEGLRPIVLSLIETMRSPSAGKEVIRTRLIRILKTIIKAFHQKRDELDQVNEGANAIFDALSKSFDENITRLKIILVRLLHEKTVVLKGQKALSESLRRAQRITILSQKLSILKQNQCHFIKVSNNHLYSSLQNRKSITSQIEEILQERFGALKTFFRQRKLRFKESK